LATSSRARRRSAAAASLERHGSSAPIALNLVVQTIGILVAEGSEKGDRS
jgi:hypothetical protein